MSEPEVRENRLALCLMGPTASGKTEVALELARHRPVDLISVDSAMVYRGMDIGTAKPGPEILAEFPHALIDIREPHQTYSVAAFVDDAERCIEAAFRAGRLPVLVGGTMLYFKALLEGLADLPRSDPARRRALEREVARDGIEALYGRLRSVDPIAAEGIDPHNTQRVLRALEVYESSGRPISSYWAEQRSRGVAARLDCQPLSFALVPPRPVIHDRIAARFDEMLAAGLLDEVATLRERPELSRELPALRAVGYRQVWDHLDGRVGEAEMIARALAATRQLARRQLTWLRRWPDLTTLDPTTRDVTAVVLQYLDAVAIVA